MRICHITPHLPPDQAANALLPVNLGIWARRSGHQVTFIAHPARAAVDHPERPGELPGPVVWVPRHERGAGILGTLGIRGLLDGQSIARTITPLVESADIVHIHSNGLLAEIGAWVARRLGKPHVLTLYGTEIWHYQPRRLGPDLFTKAYHGASAVTFYSRKLLERATEVGLERSSMHVVYPPVGAEFVAAAPEEREAARAALGVRARHLLLNVKRLHPLAGQRFLIDAMPGVLAAHRETHLVVCGTGSLLDDLLGQARSLGIEGSVSFAGLLDNRVIAQYDRAADVFVLPSLLEACPTVAVEALACGTPVVSSDNPGGVELNALFGDDVRVVPRENPGALAGAIVRALDEKRRAQPATSAIIEREFSSESVGNRFFEIYQTSLGGRQPSSPLALGRRSDDR